MRREVTWVVLFGVAMAVMALNPEEARATPPEGFTSTTLAVGQFGQFNVFNEFVLPDGSVKGHNPGIWRSRQKVNRLSDGYFLTNAWQPGGTTGWHTHLGHTMIIVTAGTVTHYDGDDPNCTPHVYTAGMTFVDEGGTHIHIVRNEGTVEADVIAFRLIPTGQPGRIDADDPGNCPF